MLAKCPKNRELLKCVVEKLTRIEELSREQRTARTSEDRERAAQLDRELEVVVGEKERSVGAWQEHVREHGC